MEKEKDNYYRFICVINEVGRDVQRCRLKRSCISSNFQTLSHFLNDRDVLHTLLHLFFEIRLCCWKGCCKTQRAKGFSTNQWDILYDADPSLCCKQNEKICICCVTAKNVSESDLDISLLSLILNNCCNLTPNEKIAVQSLRDMKNNYISHRTNMSLSNSDFQSLWCQVEHHIKHLDSTNTYLYQQQILLHRPMDVSLVQKYFNNCWDASAQYDSGMKDLHAIIVEREERVIEAINDNFSQVNRKQEHILKSLQKLQSTKEYKQSESNNAGDCITTKRKRHELAVCLDVSNEEDINADNYMSKKRKQQKLLKGQIDDLRYKLPDTKPLDESKEYISSTLIGSKLPTAVSLQMDYKVCTMKDLTKQQGFKKADKYICGECDWLTISLDEFLKHKQQCIMRQKENHHVKNEYKKYVVAKITVPTKDKDLSSKIEKEWQQGNINPQHSSIEVTYITTGCVVIWVKVELLLFLNISKFYSELDYLVNEIFQKYAVNLPLSRVEIYDIATGYVDNLADEFHCGDCELKCNTLENYISHKKTRCFQHILPEITTMENSNYKIVAAIDFGTAYSGCAFCFMNDLKKEPLKIQANQVWMTGSSQFKSLITPNCLLLDKDQKFVAFGFQAENMYAQCILDDVQDDFYYFHRSNMYLHSNKNINRTMVLQDITGKTMSAFDVFKLSIKALVNHLMETLDKQGTGVKHDEIQWVLNVPAIWTDTAKQFMRFSAEEAGLNPDILILSLEPEAASSLCQYLPITKSEMESTVSKIGTKCIVVDFGGGNTDITVVEVENDQLKEKHRDKENNCGGTSVDSRFFILLEKIFGKQLMESLKKEDPLANLDIERGFKAAKRNIDPNNKVKVSMTFPFTTLDKLCKEINKQGLDTLVKASDYANEIKLHGDKIRFDVDLFVKLFQPSIDSVISLMTEVLSSKNTKGVTHFLMVGGFSECNLLENEIHKSFPGKRIIVRKDAGLSVLKGAVLFGHSPDFIISRIMPRTYGVMTSLPFDPRKFDKKYRVVMGGEERCDKLFSLIASVDNSVEAGTKVEKSYLTPSPNQEKMDFNVYVSTEANPCYVDEEGCKHLCTPAIEFPEICPDKRLVDVEFELGNAEIKMTAKDRKSGKQVKAQINLLHP